MQKIRHNLGLGDAISNGLHDGWHRRLRLRSQGPRIPYSGEHGYSQIQTISTNDTNRDIPSNSGEEERNWQGERGQDEDVRVFCIRNWRDVERHR